MCPLWQVVQERFLPAVQQRVLATGMALHQTQGLGVFADFLDLGSFHHPDISRVSFQHTCAQRIVPEAVSCSGDRPEPVRSLLPAL